ncbi:universal stress protein [Mycobacterium sp. GA-2829]|uniref:universal stress protein n=1 Tax=Mycobacterium sp. GA-2829 TaxID=1772283 RepID=UPI000B25717B|nr:universal stress protein [Mycobacterium sp. GA-2829]
MSEAAASVLVGVDPSEAAANAAVWAVEEALSRSVPLTLVSATGPVHPSADGPSGEGGVQ